MITYPGEWNVDYEKVVSKISESQTSYWGKVYNYIVQAVKSIDISNLAYSGGIDSTIMLHIMSQYINQTTKETIKTFTIASREDHPDIIFARQGAEYYHTDHTEYIVPELINGSGDDAVKHFFKSLPVESIICCDGIDELMCGYYDHLNQPEEKYKYYLSRLTLDHLIPLDENSFDVKVYLPYLYHQLVKYLASVHVRYKINQSTKTRKIMMVELASRLGVPKDIINRNKYGFCDALLASNK